MAMTNAQKQAAYKARKADAGFRQIQVWVKGSETPPEALRRLIDEIEARDRSISAEAALDIVTARLWGLYEDFGGWEGSSS